MPRFVHISDLHFGREQPEVIAGWFKITAELQPDLIIISGDLTQRATDTEYLAAQQFLSQLPWPYFVIPGNHDMSATDLAERFFKPWKKWQHYIAPDLEPVLDLEHTRIVGVNTARAAGFYFDWSRGQISDQQITAVQQKFQETAATRLKIVVAHHPFWLPKNSEYRDVVERRDQAIAAFHDAGVDLILSGHVHTAYTQILQGVLIVHSGTSFSNRLSQGQANSFNLIQGDHTHLTIQFMHWNGQRFQSTEQREFQHTQGIWQQTAGLNSV